MIARWGAGIIARRGEPRALARLCETHVEAAQILELALEQRRLPAGVVMGLRRSRHNHLDIVR